MVKNIDDLCEEGTTTTPKENTPLEAEASRERRKGHFFIHFATKKSQNIQQTEINTAQIYDLLISPSPF